MELSFGNRTAESAQSGACPALLSVPTAMAAYNASNQITWATVRGAAVGFVYDAAGNVTDDSTNRHLYDAEGRICAVANYPYGGVMVMTGYLYDAEGTRVAKGTITSMSCDPAVNGFQTTTDYVLGLSGEQVTEVGVDANGNLAHQHTNVWAGSKLLGTYDNDGLHFYLDDPLGTRRVQTNYAGVVEQQCASLPYGNGESCSGTPTEHLFTGKERDNESGLDYFGARYYASTIGRFMSPDWAVKATPIPYAVLDTPQSLNLYAYVQNNPLSRNDPTGHDWFWYNKQWQWQKGHTFYNQNGAVKGLKGYEYLLVFQKTGTNEHGAATGTLSLYGDPSKGAITSNVFSGGQTPQGFKNPIPNGNYMLNLSQHGDYTMSFPFPAQMPHYEGFQTIHDFPPGSVDDGGNPLTGGFTYEWGNMRATLDHANNRNPDFQGNFIHGKNRTEGGDYTHGCICERSETILHILQGVTVQHIPVEVK